MVIADADDGAEMRHARPKGGGRKPPEQGLGASNTTARSQPSPPEVEVRLMDEIVSRANMMAAYHRVMANKGAAGIDRMTVEQLQPYLREHWPRIKEELLDGRYRPQPARGVEIPKLGGGMRHGCFELHFGPVRLWDLLRSPILFIRFAANGSLF